MPLRTAPGFADRSLPAGLETWFGEEPGSLIASAEHALLARALPDLFGYHIVQLGRPHGRALMDSSRISHQVEIELGHASNPHVQLHCAEDALPLASNSIDVLVLPHVLEFAADPRRVLREAERVLIGEGHVVILGFNPWSCLGLTSWLLRWRGAPPWCGRFIGLARVKDWLQVLGFELVQVARAAFRPPSRRPAVNRRLAFLEQLGAYCWPGLANVYLVVGRKRVEGVTPLKLAWRQRRRLVTSGAIEPTARACARTEHESTHPHG
jgi:SAM-dependent methyltransferase